MLVILIAFSACDEFDASKHPSFHELESFMEADKRIKGFHISSIDIDHSNISEFQRLKPNSSQLAYRKITAIYELTLKSREKAYKSKAEVSSIDSVNWEITSLSITHQTDSISKHFEETITWKYPVSVNHYSVTLSITDH